MSYRFKPRRKGPLARIGRVLLILLCVLLALGLVLLGADLVAERMVQQSWSDPLTRDVHYRDIDGARLAYRMAGSQGEPLVLVHGFLGSSNDFTGLMPALSAQHRVVAVDLIGFGLSDKSLSLDYSKKNMARLVHRLMQSLGYDSYAVLGHSMGGEVALQMAVNYPDHVQRLILLDSAGAADLQQGMTMDLPPWLIEHGFKNYVIQRIGFPVTVHDRRQATTRLFNQFFFFNSQIPARTLIKLTQDNDSGELADRLDTISQPVLLIWGANDRIIPLAQGQVMDQMIPDSQLVVIDACGHLPFLEAPDQVLAAIQTSSG